MRSPEKSRGWPSLEERLEKLKKTAKELGIPVELLSMILSVGASRTGLGEDGAE